MFRVVFYLLLYVIAAFLSISGAVKYVKSAEIGTLHFLGTALAIVASLVALAINNGKQTSTYGKTNEQETKGSKRTTQSWFGWSSSCRGGGEQKSASEKPHTESEYMPGSLPIYEEMMGWKSRGAHQSGSAFVPAYEESEEPEFISVYEEMLRRTSGARAKQARKPVDSSTSTGRTTSSRPNGHTTPNQKKRVPATNSATAEDGSSAPKQKQTAPTSKSTPAQDALETYITSWNTLKRHEKGWPYPNPLFTRSGLLTRGYIDTKVSNLSVCSDATIISLNTQTFFLKGHDLAFTLLVMTNEAKFIISSIRNDMEQVKALRSYLKKKELARWHPDRLNLRTGVVGGVPDARLGSTEVVAAVRTGIDELVERCEEALRAGEIGGRGR